MPAIIPTTTAQAEPTDQPTTKADTVEVTPPIPGNNTQEWAANGFNFMQYVTTQNVIFAAIGAAILIYYLFTLKTKAR